MVINKYKIIFSPTSIKEIDEIYQYISDKLKATKAAKNLINKIEKQVQLLEYYPKIHISIDQTDDKGRVYRRLTAKQYIILYVIDEEVMEVRISHIFYKKSNYLNKL